MMVCPSAHLQKGEFFMAKWFTVDHKVSCIFWVWSIVKSSFVKSYKGLVNSKLQAWTNEQRSLISEDQISPELGFKSLPVATCCWKGKKTIVDHRIPHNWTANWKLQFYNFGINHLFTVHRVPLSTSDLLTFKYETEDRHRCLSSKPGLLDSFSCKGERSLDTSLDVSIPTSGENVYLRIIWTLKSG